jgi:hypothetical protein
MAHRLRQLAAWLGVVCAVLGTAVYVADLASVVLSGDHVLRISLGDGRMYLGMIASEEPLDPVFVEPGGYVAWGAARRSATLTPASVAIRPRGQVVRGDDGRVLWVEASALGIRVATNRGFRWPGGGVQAQPRRIAELQMPGWTLVAIGSAGLLPWLRWRQRVARLADRVAAGLCVACGYNLYGTTGDCPECGQPRVYGARPSVSSISRQNAAISGV